MKPSFPIELSEEERARERLASRARERGKRYRRGEKHTETETRKKRG